MESMMMLKTATTLFVLTAVGGLLMAAMRFNGSPRPPSWLAMSHGFLAAAGLTLLIYAALTVGIPVMAQIGLGLFCVAALGGAAMNLLFHAKQLSLPIPLMITHGSLAVMGFVVLLLSALSVV